MGREFLSQDEVDALLSGVSGEAEQAPRKEEPGEGVRPYNLATQERIVRGRMPTLEIINERFARTLRLGLFNFVRRTAEIAVGPVRVVKYADFVRNLVVPINLNLIQVKPLRGTALLIFNPELVYLVIDSLFGGNGQFHTRVEGRDFTQTEHRIIQRLIEVVFDDLEKAWKPVHPLKFEFIRSEMNTQFANIATPNELVVVTTFKIELGAAGGEFHICMPYSMLEPIRDVLCSSLQGEQMDVDKRWVRLLSRQMQAAEVELIVNFGRAELTVQQVLHMQPGDVISLDVPRPLVAEVDSVPVMECKCGVFNGQYALKVERLISAANDV